MSLGLLARGVEPGVSPIETGQWSLRRIPAAVWKRPDPAFDGVSEAAEACVKDRRDRCDATFGGNSVNTRRTIAPARVIRI